ncbi:putative homeodomain transcription factor 2 [Fasciola hepatica]|uniref:Homeodomain transcription factor 2 n=1 Tax=Fasciola hepatica TaxID=6192 RepID=A0A4E0S1E1_FASHE|nr:putative homeodomain transcription factor 2 [Fasciola hepatica]
MSLGALVKYFQHKLGNYDKQSCDQSVEQRILQEMDKGTPHEEKKGNNLFIDVDLVRGSVFSKSKTRHRWIQVVMWGVLRTAFAPLYWDYWREHTSFRMAAYVMFHFLVQLIQAICFLLIDPETSKSTQDDVFVPCLLAVLLGILHAHITAAHGSIGSSVLKQSDKEFNHLTTHSSSSRLEPDSRSFQPVATQSTGPISNVSDQERAFPINSRDSDPQSSQRLSSGPLGNRRGSRETNLMTSIGRQDSSPSRMIVRHRRPNMSHAPIEPEGLSSDADEEEAEDEFENRCNGCPALGVPESTGLNDRHAVPWSRSATRFRGSTTNRTKLPASRLKTASCRHGSGHTAGEDEKFSVHVTERTEIPVESEYHKQSQSLSKPSTPADLFSGLFRLNPWRSTSDTSLLCPIQDHKSDGEASETETPSDQPAQSTAHTSHGSEHAASGLARPQWTPNTDSVSQPLFISTEQCSSSGPPSNSRDTGKPIALGWDSVGRDFSSMQALRATSAQCGTVTNAVGSSQAPLHSHHHHRIGRAFVSGLSSAQSTSSSNGSQPEHTNDRSGLHRDLESVHGVGAELCANPKASWNGNMEDLESTKSDLRSVDTKSEFGRIEQTMNESQVHTHRNAVAIETPPHPNSHSKLQHNFLLTKKTSRNHEQDEDDKSCKSCEFYESRQRANFLQLFLRRAYNHRQQIRALNAAHLSSDALDESTARVHRTNQPAANVTHNGGTFFRLYDTFTKKDELGRLEPPSFRRRFPTGLRQSAVLTPQSKLHVNSLGSPTTGMMNKWANIYAKNLERKVSFGTRDRRIKVTGCPSRTTRPGVFFRDASNVWTREPTVRIQAPHSPAHWSHGSDEMRLPADRSRSNAVELTPGVGIMTGPTSCSPVETAAAEPGFDGPLSVGLKPADRTEFLAEKYSYRHPAREGVSKTWAQLPSGANDTIACYVWEGDKSAKCNLTMLDVGWNVIRCECRRSDRMGRMVIFLGVLLRFNMFSTVFLLLCIAERTFQQRLLYAKYFFSLTSGRRARKYHVPQFRLNKLRHIKCWLTLRSYLKKRGPQRSVENIIVASFYVVFVFGLALGSQFISKKNDQTFSRLINLDMMGLTLGIALFQHRFLVLGTKITKKYRNLSIIITEQINLYLSIEKKPYKKDDFLATFQVLRLVEGLLKEVDGPFRICGWTVNPLVYNVFKLVLLSCFSTILSDAIGFKLKLHKLKLNAANW